MVSILEVGADNELEVVSGDTGAVGVEVFSVSVSVLVSVSVVLMFDVETDEDSELVEDVIGGDAG